MVEAGVDRLTLFDFRHMERHLSSPQAQLHASKQAVEEASLGDVVVSQ